MAEVLDFTQPHLLRNEEEYDIAIAEIDALLDADPPLAPKGMSGWSFYLFWCRLMKTLISRLMRSPRPKKWLILCWSRRAFLGPIWQSGWEVEAEHRNFLMEFARSLFGRLAH